MSVPSIKSRFLVYVSSTYTWARLVFCALPLVLFLVILYTNQMLLIFPFVTVTFIAICVELHLLATIELSPRGIRFLRPFLKSWFLDWDDVCCAGSYYQKTIGKHKNICFIYFSKNSISLNQLENITSFPSQTNDFLYIAKQPNLFEAITFYCPSKRIGSMFSEMMLYDSPEIENNYPRRSLTPILFFVVVALALCVFCGIITRDTRWWIATALFAASIIVVKIMLRK